MACQWGEVENLTHPIWGGFGCVKYTIVILPKAVTLWINQAYHKGPI